MIRPIVTADLPAAVALLEISGLGGAQANLARYLRCQPSCGWAAIVDGAIAGIVTLLSQGRVGFVGAMAVHPAHRGTGLGRALLEYAQARARGIETFLLEATPLGEHLYRRLGYVPEHESVILSREGAIEPIEYRIAPSDHAAIATLDRIATGTVRDDMLADLLSEGGPGTTVHVHREAVGAGLVIGDRLGPVLATHVGVGRALVDQLAVACRVVTIPEPNQAALAAVAMHGFREVRRLRRMRLGPPVPVRTDWIWALASPGAG